MKIEDISFFSTATIRQFPDLGKRIRVQLCDDETSVGVLSMPASYVIDKLRRLVITTASGVLTFPDCVQHQDRLIKDPEFDPTYNQLLDFLEVTNIRLDELALRFLMVRHVFSGQSRRAVVGRGTPFEEFARAAIELRKKYLGTESTRIFSDREEALSWLSFRD